MPPISILMTASEVEPFAKTGGLADVSAALPKALKKEGVTVKIVLPLYKDIDRKKYNLKPFLKQVCVHMGNCEEWFAVYTTTDSAGNDVYFIEFDKYFARDGYYHTYAGEFQDNAYRFAFFSRAALQLAKDMNFAPDVIHVNDWQTSLIPYYLKTLSDPFFAKTKSVLTIHNIGYQGVFSPHVLEYAGIRYGDFHAGAFEAVGNLNLLKGGITFADAITTVSPTYAQEILTPEQSGGLHDTLKSRLSSLKGIINGIDTAQWNPANDSLIAKKYDVTTYTSGKQANKEALQKRLGLQQNPNIPLISFIGRFASQKGVSLLAEIIEKAVTEMECQFVILGSGEAEYETLFGNLPTLYPGKIGAFIGYSNEVAHLTEAGSDFFVMPSRYEPCGLNQMYSLAYGTLPIVRATGGLHDTVENYNEQTGGGTGFKFWDFSAKALYNTIGWAVSTYFDRPHHIDNMIQKGMQTDFSWENSAREYIELYQSLIS